MRAMLPAMACVLLVGLAGACSGQSESEPAAVASEAAAPAAPKPSATAELPMARKESVSNDLYEFEYVYPVEAAAIPDLRKWLDADLEKQRRELIENAQEQLATAKHEGFPFNPLGTWISWSVVTDLPGFLSLSAQVGSYEGGAHPNHGFDEMVWDKPANVRRESEDFFTSEQALSQAIRAEFCRQIDRQRARKRQGEDLGAGGPFTECIDPVESTVILGSSNRKAFDKIGILVGPYEAGPYAEGDYEVTLPVTDAILAAVKPEYRAIFVKGR